MASVDTANDETYNKEYRRLKTLTSQTDIVEGSVSFRCVIFALVLPSFRSSVPSTEYGC